MLCLVLYCGVQRKISGRVVVGIHLLKLVDNCTKACIGGNLFCLELYLEVSSYQKT